MNQRRPRKIDDGPRSSVSRDRQPLPGSLNDHRLSQAHAAYLVNPSDGIRERFDQRHQVRRDVQRQFVHHRAWMQTNVRGIAAPQSCII
jgi:hypothetical protein